MSADSDLVLRNLLDACDRGRPLSDIHDRLRVEVGRLGCPECGGTGARGCGAAWHDGKPDAPSPLDEPSELIDVAASHSRWLRHNGYVQPADCMDRLCELLVLVTGRLTGEPTAAPTRPTREQLAEVLGKALDCWNGAGEEEGALEWYLAGNLTPLLAGEGTPERERAEAEQEAIRDAGSWEEQRTLLAGATPYVAGEGTAQPDPSEISNEQTMAAALAPFGWKCGPEFWDRYYHDPWTFNLANAVERLSRRASGEGTAPQPDQGHGVRLVHGPDCDECQKVRRIVTRGTALQVPAEVLGYADAAALRHHIHALLTRVDRWVESVEGTPSPWALVGDMADVLRRVLVWAHSPGVNPDGWHYRYLIAAGGDTEQLWAIQPTGSENPRHRVVPCLIRASDLDEVDDEEATPDPSRRPTTVDRRHPLDAAVDNAEAGDDHVIMRRGRPVAVLVGIDRYDELRAELERLSPSGGAPQPEADER